MQEHHYDTEWHNITDGEHINGKEGFLDGLFICKLVLDHLTIDQPTQDDTRQEGSHGQHQLGSQEIAEVQQRHTE